MLRKIPVAGLVAGLAGCASAPAAHFSGAVDLGPGGRAEATLVVPAGDRAELELVNRGPGRVDFSVRDARGRTWASGSLGTAGTPVGGTDGATLTVTLTASPDASSTVAYDLRGPEGFDLTWDLSKSFPGPAPGDGSGR